MRFFSKKKEEQYTVCTFCLTSVFMIKNTKIYNLSLWIATTILALWLSISFGQVSLRNPNHLTDNNHLYLDYGLTWPVDGECDWWVFGLSGAGMWWSMISRITTWVWNDPGLPLGSRLCERWELLSWNIQSPSVWLAERTCAWVNGWNDAICQWMVDTGALATAAFFPNRPAYSQQMNWFSFDDRIQQHMGEPHGSSNLSRRREYSCVDKRIPTQIVWLDSFNVWSVRCGSATESAEFWWWRSSRNNTPAVCGELHDTSINSFPDENLLCPVWLSPFIRDSGDYRPRNSTRDPLIRGTYYCTSRAFDSNDIGSRGDISVCSIDVDPRCNQDTIQQFANEFAAWEFSNHDGIMSIAESTTNDDDFCVWSSVPGRGHDFRYSWSNNEFLVWDCRWASGVTDTCTVQRPTQFEGVCQWNPNTSDRDDEDMCPGSNLIVRGYNSTVGYTDTSQYWSAYITSYQCKDTSTNTTIDCYNISCDTADAWWTYCAIQDAECGSLENNTTGISSLIPDSTSDTHTIEPVELCQVNIWGNIRPAVSAINIEPRIPVINTNGEYKLAWGCYHGPSRRDNCSVRRTHDGVCRWEMIDDNTLPSEAQLQNINNNGWTSPDLCDYLTGTNLAPDGQGGRTRTCPGIQWWADTTCVAVSPSPGECNTSIQSQSFSTPQEIIALWACSRWVLDTQGILLDDPQNPTQRTRSCNGVHGSDVNDTWCTAQFAPPECNNSLTNAYWSSQEIIDLWACSQWVVGGAGFSLDTWPDPALRRWTCEWFGGTFDTCDAEFSPPKCNDAVTSWWSPYELDNHAAWGRCSSGTPWPIVPFTDPNTNQHERRWTCHSPIPEALPIDCSATVTKPQLPVSYNPADPGPGLYVYSDVLATLLGVTPWVITITNNPSADYNFTVNGTFTYQYANFAWLTGETIANVTWIDDRLPTAEVRTCQDGPTNQSVVVSLTDFNTPGISVQYNGPWTITNLGTAPDFRDIEVTVDDNTGGHFVLTNRNGTTNLPFSVTCIDRIPPSASVQYSTTRPTAWSVTATLINPTEPFTVTNNSGQASYTFDDNGSYIFELIDAAGNTWAVTAAVSWIDKTAPHASCQSRPDDSVTSGAVLVFLDEFTEDGIIITNNSGQNSAILTGNGSFDFHLLDLAGNEGTVTCEVDNIDNRVLPTLIEEYTAHLCPRRYRWQVVDIINHDQYVYIQTMIKNCFMKVYPYQNKAFFFPNKQITVGEFVSLMGRVLQFTNDYDDLIRDEISDYYLDARAQWERKEDLSEADTLGLLVYIRVTQENHLTKVDANRPITPREARRLFKQVLEIAGVNTSLADTYIVDYGAEGAFLTRADVAFILSQFLRQYEHTIVGNNLDFLQLLRYRIKPMTIPAREQFIGKLLWYMRALPSHGLARMWLDKRLLVQDLYRVITGKEAVKLAPRATQTSTIMDDRFPQYIDTRNNEVNNTPEHMQETQERPIYYDQSF